MYFHDICGAKLENIDNITECPKCLCPLKKERISPIPDGSLVKAISTDESFMNAMVELYENNPIEYQLKIQQFKTQLQQQKQIEEKGYIVDNAPKCPTCQSTNLKKITATSKAMNTALFGLFGTKRHKTYHCNNCGYEW
nr:hypothetical protein [uncultured Acetatifactor sp.]